jgi:origin recognition complex subunit 6
MLQDATDYLGERQRQDYQAWKAKIMARVAKIEAGA